MAAWGSPWETAGHLSPKILEILGAFFWDYSGIELLGIEVIDGIRVLLGAIPFSD